MKHQVIKHYEGLHDGDLSKIGLQPKMDPSGIWTEGWGHAIHQNGKFIRGAANKALAYKLATVKTEAEADALLEKDVLYSVLQIKRKITVALSEKQLEALTSFVYNTGGSPTLFMLINTKSPKLFDWWCNHYITSKGVTLRGLIFRRQTEATLFCKGVLKFFN